MFYYGKIDLSEATYVAKSNGSKECKVCHYWYFNNGFEFQYSFVTVVMI